MIKGLLLSLVPLVAMLVALHWVDARVARMPRLTDPSPPEPPRDL